MRAALTMTSAIRANRTKRSRVHNRMGRAPSRNEIEARCLTDLQRAGTPTAVHIGGVACPTRIEDCAENFGGGKMPGVRPTLRQGRIQPSPCGMGLSRQAEGREIN